MDEKGDFATASEVKVRDKGSQTFLEGIGNSANK